MNALPPIHLWFPGVVAMLCLVVASGFFSASETALFYLSHEELRGMRVGTFREKIAAGLMKHPDRLLTAVLFWNLVINLSFFATSVVVSQRLLADGYRVAGGLFGLISLVAIILLGEVIPKTGAVIYRRSFASLVSLPLAAAVSLLDPITPTLRKMTVIARRTFWPKLQREPFLDADDLERAVEASELGVEAIRHERQILHNVLDLSEITTEEVMWPRGTYPSMTAPIHRADLQGEVGEPGYVIVLPSDEQTIERAIPLTEFSVVPESHLEQAAEDVVHVPWCANLADTLQLLRDRICSVAVVVNEYGESIGIVTYDDILDMILMPEPSRAKRVLKREPVLQVSPGNFHVEGMTSLRYLSRRLDLDDQPATEGVLTVAGMLHDELEHLPSVGDECIWRGYHIKVIEAPRPGRVRVLFSRQLKTDSDSDDETSNG